MRGGKAHAREVAREASVAAVRERTSRCAKRALWRRLAGEAAACGGSCAKLFKGPESCGRWIERSLLRGLAFEARSADAKKELAALRVVRRGLAAWLSPRTAGSRCRKAEKEAASFATATAAEAMLALYVGKVRRCDNVWTRYLRPRIQEKLLRKPVGVSDALAAEVRSILELAVAKEGNGVLLYAVVPRGSQKWYVGQAHVKRKDRGRVAAGFPTRMLEHLAAAASAAARMEAKDKGGPKYSLWRALGSPSFVFRSFVIWYFYYSF